MTWNVTTWKSTYVKLVWLCHGVETKGLNYLLTGSSFLWNPANWQRRWPNLDNKFSLQPQVRTNLLTWKYILCSDSFYWTANLLIFLLINNDFARLIFPHCDRHAIRPVRDPRIGRHLVLNGANSVIVDELTSVLEKISALQRPNRQMIGQLNPNIRPNVVHLNRRVGYRSGKER